MAAGRLARTEIHLQLRERRMIIRTWQKIWKSTLENPPEFHKPKCDWPYELVGIVKV